MYTDLSLVIDAFKQVLVKSTGGCRTPSRCGVDGRRTRDQRGAGLKSDGSGTLHDRLLTQNQGRLSLNRATWRACGAPPGNRVQQGLSPDPPTRQSYQQEETLPHLHRHGIERPTTQMKRLPARVKQALFVPEAPNQVWSMDFMNDSFLDREPFRMIKIVDNGPELISIKLDLWCRENGVALAFIQPDKPTQNAFIERFNRTVRKEALNA